MQRLLCVTAHPDDEVVAFGGALLTHQRRGGLTAVVCLTRGEAASHRQQTTPAELGEMRSREFATACQLLGVAHAEILDYPDGQLEAQPFNAVVARLTGVMRRWRPHVVLTFGPDGGLTAHRDHAMTSHFATAAFHAAPRPHGLPDEPRPYRPQKLYFATAMVTTPGRGPTAPAPAGTRIEVADLVHAKIAAFRAHESQAALRPVVERVLRRHGTEWFHLAACVRPSEARLETDLFEGIVEDDERSPQ